MDVVMWIALGTLLGMYGPRAITWALLWEEHVREGHAGPRRRRVGIDELLSDDYDDENRPLTRRELRNRRLL